MIHTTEVRGKCKSSNIIRNGHNQSGTAQYLCKDCGTCRVLKSKRRTKQIDLEALSRTYEERNSYRSTGRFFGISHDTIRQRFSRLVRKTLSFSKKEYMLNLHFKLWAFQYNQNILSRKKQHYRNVKSGYQF